MTIKKVNMPASYLIKLVKDIRNLGIFFEKCNDSLPSVQLNTFCKRGCDFDNSKKG